jgi:hypothetical protein
MMVTSLLLKRFAWIKKNRRWHFAEVFGECDACPSNVQLKPVPSGRPN